MSAYGAHLRSLFAYNDMTAIGTYPYHLLVTAEDKAALNIGKQLSVSLLMLLLYLGDLLKQECDVGKALLACLFGKACIHIRPFIVFTGCGVGKVGGGIRHFTVMQELEPYLGVLLFVCSGFLKDIGYLLISVLPGLGSVIGLFVARLRFSGKCRHEIGFCF